MKINARKLIRFVSLSLVSVMLCACLFGCAARPLSPTRDATASVGKVGGYDVPFEEFYFLAKNYDTENMSSDELWETVSENIVANYAILALCDEAGVVYGEDELEDNIDTYIESMIDSDFGEERQSYLDALKESNMTDHYLRFTVRVDLLYSKLATALATQGELASTDAEIAKYIEENFVRTRHIMLSGEGAQERAEAALEKLRRYETTISTLIGNGTNEDLLIPGDGYVFTRGSMEKAYEDAAFGLKVSTSTTSYYSDVINAGGELGTGEYVDCCYIIERLPLDEDYIYENLGTLRESYEESLVGVKLEEKKAELSFVPNEYALSLDIKSLPALSIGTDTYLYITLGAVGAGVIALGLGIFFTVRHFTKKKKAQLAEKAARALKK